MLATPSACAVVWKIETAVVEEERHQKHSRGRSSHPSATNAPREPAGPRGHHIDIRKRSAQNRQKAKLASGETVTPARTSGLSQVPTEQGTLIQHRPLGCGNSTRLRPSHRSVTLGRTRGHPRPVGLASAPARVCACARRGRASRRPPCCEAPSRSSWRGAPALQHCAQPACLARRRCAFHSRARRLLARRVHSGQARDMHRQSS